MLTDTEIDLDELDDQVTDDGADDGDDEPKGRSVRDSLEKAWEKHGGELTEDRKDARERRREERQERKGRERTETKGGTKDAQGRFTSREARSDAAPDERVSPKPESQEAATQLPVDGPSVWWKNEGKQLWDRLDPQAKSLLTQRENLITQGARQIQERYGGIHRLTQHLAPRFQRYNLTPDRGFANMASWFEAIENNPAQGISELAKLYKVDPRTFGAAAPQPTPGVSPNGQAPQARQPADPRIDQLMRWASEMIHTRSNEVQQAKLTSWSPNKPHFVAVRSLMSDMLKASIDAQDPRYLNDDGTDVDLDKLYEAAIRVHPEIGLKVIEEQAEAKRKEQQARIAQARRAGGSLRPGTPGSVPSKGERPAKGKKGETAGETIRRVWDELRST